MSLMVPKTNSENGMRTVEMIIVRTAKRRFNPAISTRAGLANTEPAVVVASKIIVTSGTASIATQSSVTMAGTMNICHETMVQVNVSIFRKISMGLSSREFIEKTTTKKSAKKIYGRHSSARAGKSNPVPMAITISKDDQDRSLEESKLAFKSYPHC